MRESEPTLNELINSINNHVETLKAIEAKALVARSQPAKAKSYSNPNKFCKYCKKENHDISECKKLERKKEETNQQPKPSFAMMATTSKLVPSAWLADSGCSLHMTNNLNWIFDYRELTVPISIRLSDDRTIQALGFGLVKTSVRVIHNVHFVPAIQSNLFSISSATNQGIEVNIKKNLMTFSKDVHIITQANQQNKVYIMDFKIAQHTCASATLEEWHQRFGHISLGTVKEMQKSGAVIGLDIKNSSKDICEDCIIKKCTAASHPSRTSAKASKPGLVLHADTYGPMKEIGFDQEKFVLICKDECSGFRMTSCLRQKSQIPEELMKMIRRTELETGTTPAKICTDNCSEFINDRLTSFFNDHGINHHLSATTKWHHRTRNSHHSQCSSYSSQFSTFTSQVLARSSLHC